MCKGRTIRYLGGGGGGVEKYEKNEVHLYDQHSPKTACMLTFFVDPWLDQYIRSLDECSRHTSYTHVQNDHLAGPY